MLTEMIDTGTALKDAGQTSNINERAKYTANTGSIIINTSNTNLAPTGTIAVAIGATGKGTLVKSITVQALDNTTKGLIRLFFANGSANFLIDEIVVPATVRSAISPAFSITYDLDFFLQNGETIRVTTVNSEPFAITTQALDFSY